MALFGSKARRRAERQSIESAQAAAMRYLDSIVRDDPTICPRRPRTVNVSGVIGDRIEQDYGQRVRAFMSALSELESTRASDAAMRAFKLATVCLAAEVYTSSEERSKINQGRSSKGRPLWDWDLSDAMVAESRRAAPPDSRRSGNDYRSDGPAGGSDQFLGMTRSLPTIRTQADLDRALAAKTRPTRVELAAVSTTLLSDIEQQPADVRRTLNESHRITADLSELSDEQITAIDRRTGTGWLLDTMAAAGSGYLVDYETYMAQASSAGHDRLLLDASFAAAEMFYALLGGFDQPLQ